MSGPVQSVDKVMTERNVIGFVYRLHRPLSYPGNDVKEEIK